MINCDFTSLNDIINKSSLLMGDEPSKKQRFLVETNSRIYTPAILSGGRGSRPNCISY